MMFMYNWNHHLYGKGDSMKKKMLTVVIVIIAVIALVFVGWYVIFVHFGIGPAFPFLPEQEVSMENLHEVQEGMTAEEQLMALVETEEEAQSIAEQYGIEFESFSDGVAVYKTEEDPAAVIARGEENGYPPLYLNMTRTTMMTTD